MRIRTQSDRHASSPPLGCPRRLAAALGLTALALLLLAAPALALPDGRQWEMVSPPEKNGGLILESPEGRYTTRVSVHGDAIAYVDTKPVEANPLGFDGWGWVLSSRLPGAWSSRNLSPAYEQPTSLSGRGAEEFPAFAEDLSRAVMMPSEGAPIGLGELPPEEASEAAGAHVPYMRTNYINNTVAEVCVVDCLQPIVWTGNVPAGTDFNRYVSVEGASGDARHVLLISYVALTTQPLEETSGLYEWFDGALSLVSILPKSEGGQQKAASGTISSNGSVVWRPIGVYKLYLYDAATDETLRLDTNQGGVGGGLPGAVFAAANPSYSRIFFTDPERLTPDSTASDTNTAFYPDLYVYDRSRPAGSRLSDLSIDPHAGEHANVSSVLGAFNEGNDVYYTAPGALASGAIASKRNLYLAHYSGSAWEAPKLVTILPADASRTTISPNGRYLLFRSSQKLTAYDNTDANTGLPDPELYMYDLKARSLVCVSCNPSGARPIGGAELPPAGRFLLDDGRVFFQTTEALALADVNGQRDVYQFEPEGTGGCTSADPGFSAEATGCIDLISSGTGAEGANLLGTSQTGEDVFFLTTQKLLSQDIDTAPDIYDAHVCRSAAPCLPEPPPPPPQCSTADSCRSAPGVAPTVSGAPASASVSGAGNVSEASASGHRRAQTLARALRACRKIKSRPKRDACVRRAKRHYGRAR